MYTLKLRNMLARMDPTAERAISGLLSIALIITGNSRVLNSSWARSLRNEESCSRNTTDTFDLLGRIVLVKTSSRNLLTLALSTSDFLAARKATSLDPRMATLIDGSEVRMAST
eukprot:GFUD01100037.1.p1 GENE.GFUD01100037.1~~GFUD01100037.1.p1  ORF type:complete len:114 (+),score=13.31 GFUD01100037.1:784-1125(+)